jgi:long-subunit fatty acid transport protein
MVNKMQRSLFLFILVTIYFAGINSALAVSKSGTSAAQFLKIGIGPRASALGGSFTGVADDVTGLYWNPAGTALIKRRQFLASHTEWFAGINHEFAGLVIPISSATTIGASFTALSTPDMEQTTIEQPDGTGIFFDVQDISAGLTFARRMTERFSFGATVKYIQQKLFNESASTFAVDLGGMLHTGFKGMQLGIMMSNFGGKLRLDGRDLIITADQTAARLETQSWPLPISFRIGLAMDLIGLREGLMLRESQRLTLLIDGYNVNDAPEMVSLGVEYSWNENFFLRSGYRINHDMENLSGGLGVQFPVQRWMIQADYSLSNMGDLGIIQRIGLGFQF